MTFNAIPARRSPRDDANFRAMLVIGLLILCALMGVVSFLGWVFGGGGEDDGPDYVPPKGEAVAMRAAIDFLGGKAPSVDVATPAGMEYSVPSAPIGGDKVFPLDWLRTSYAGGDGVVHEIEVHTFIYWDTEGKPGVIEVPVSIQNGAAVVTGTPQLIPYRGVDNPRPVQIFGEEVQISDVVRDKIQRWARAYFSDDRNTLNEFAGGGRDIRGVTGWKVEAVMIVSYRSAGIPTRNIAWVRVDVSKGDAVVSQSFELIIDTSNPEIPLITGWGPLGSGDFLY